MKIEINRDVLQKVIQKLRFFLAKEPINPILAHFLFEINNKKLFIKATNLKIASVWYTSFDSDEEFSFSLPGDTFSNLLSSLEGDLVCFEYSPTTKDVVLTSGNYKWEAVSGNITEYPKIGVPPVLTEINLPPNFSDLLKSVFFSISDDTAPAKADLNSLCIDINKDSNKKITLIATDKIRLCGASTDIDFPESIRLTLPKNSVGEIIKLCPQVMLFDAEKLKIFFKTNEMGGILLVHAVLSNIIYPDVYVYLDNKFNDLPEIAVKKKELLKVLKRIKITADKTSKGASFEIEGTSLKIATVGAYNKSQETLDLIKNNGDKTTFSVNIEYLLDYLNQETDEIINLKIIKGKCLIFDKEGYRHVLSVNS